MLIIRRQKKRKKDADLQIDAFYKKESNGIGIAVDIGTTTIAITAMDLSSGEILGSISETNEQTKWGADVMMRIMHCQAGREEILHEMVVSQVETMTDSLLEQIEKKDSSLGESIEKRKVAFQIVGNTTMCHIFLGKDVSGLAGYPFCPAYTGNVFTYGEQVGMKQYRDSSVCVLAGISAHVGSDTLAVIGAEKLYQPEKNQLAIDLGTNAEIVINQKGNIHVCSTAAGPAFEGKGVACGMPAKEGAITGVKISPTNGNRIIEVIEGREPKGLCGSGLVDLTAQLVKCRIIQKDGYMISAREGKKLGISSALLEQIQEKEGQRVFCVAPQVYISQQDIRNIQLAKAAIEAGILALLEDCHMTMEQMEEVIVTGVLGSCLRPGNGKEIGLIPNVPVEKLRFVGNGAGKGALLCLASQGLPEQLEKLSLQISHLELALETGFQKKLMDSMTLEPW